MSSNRPTNPRAARELRPLPAGHPTRGGPTDPSHDDELRRGILHTRIGRPTAAFLTGLFLLIIGAVSIAQTIMERVKGDESVLPDLFSRWPTQDSIKQFEEDLEKASYPREAIRPRLQLALTAIGGFGNSKAVVGKNGWLFYQPGLVAVGGPGLLDPPILRSRAKAALDAGGEAVYPDPRPAILDFHAFLASRGIRLILFPVPDKAGLQPAQLHGRVGGGRGLSPGRNPDQDRLVAELESAGVLVFDPTPARLDPGQPLFLQQDTHWTPAWMEDIARALGAFIRQRVALNPNAPSRPWTTVSKTVSRVGDVVDMIGLPAGQTLFAPQTVTVHEVQDGAGALFEPKPAAEVLLLGDSFTNVFTLEQMGWGEAAGLAPQLARALQRDVDVIAQNDSGAFATRKLLSNELASPEAGQPDRLAGKKVVIWEFASRELAVGNWKPLHWPRPSARRDGNGAGPSGPTDNVTPKPRSAP